MPGEDFTGLRSVLDESDAEFDRVLREYTPEPALREIGTVESVSGSIIRVTGLPGIRFEELARMSGGQLGIVMSLEDAVFVVLLDKGGDIGAGSEVRRTGRVTDVPVGDALLGRVVDPLGHPLDDGGPLPAAERRIIEREAPAIMDRSPVTVPLQTGIQVIDALIPIGRGQRELILGDRQTGKTAIAIDTILNQRDHGVICIYCSIGQESAGVAKIIDDLRNYGALDYTIVVAASGEDPPGLNYIAPYAATTMGEYFMERGRDVLVVYDDLTRHAWSYRELSLLMRRPPAREAYPGDIFFIHSRLLERATHLRDEKGGGSLTALPIIETEAQNISAYIPTNLISITDGQIYLSPGLFQQGMLPAADVGRSVSRVGGQAQLPAYREVAGNLRLSYSQFEELEAFSRFGARLEEETRRTLEHGRRVREVFKQVQYHPLAAPEQIAVLLAVSEGVLDEIPLDTMGEAEERIRTALRERLPEVSARILEGKKLDDADKKSLLDLARESTNDLRPKGNSPPGP